MKPIFALAAPLVGLLALTPPANAALALSAERPAGGIQVPPPQDGPEVSAPTGGIQAPLPQGDLELSPPTGGLQAALPPCPKGKRRARREGRVLCIDKKAKANQSRRQGR